jgi:transposase
MVETLNDNFMGESTMPRLLMVRKPTPTEFGRLNELIEEAPTPRQRRKAQALVLYYLGMNARDIAIALGAHPNTIYTDLQVFGQRGWASIQEAAPMGAPARLQEAQIREVQRIAQTAPVELGEPYGRWSLTTLRAYLMRHRVLRKISREHLRQLLKKGASTGGTSNAD